LNASATAAAGRQDKDVGCVPDGVRPILGGALEKFAPHFI